MSLPRIIHRIWIGPPPTIKQLRILINARTCIEGINVRTSIESSNEIRRRLNDDAELWLWTTSANIFYLQREYQLMHNIVMHDINTIWSHPFARRLPVTALRSVYQRECRGALHNYAAASDIVRLIILYCYGGVYLDMDVEFKTKSDMDEEIKKKSSILFSNLADIGDRLGILGDFNGISGNGVLASKPQTEPLRCCLEDILAMYVASTDYRDVVWREKRCYKHDGLYRKTYTVGMSGPGGIYRAMTPEQVYPIDENMYFKPIDASGRSFTQRPELLRRDSAPDFEH
ncbi:TPA: hypothetical protein G8O00_000916 [Salmonella enterica]|uniref:Glycosyl transferase n=1 Tax=Salmonella enterica TaxID=28901 RepID=A0A747SP97_SALER|nr:hypothetical protein [Salmonella enterica]HAF4697560.1 hypothetical protein [Salmonella enterica]